MAVSTTYSRFRRSRKISSRQHSDPTVPHFPIHAGVTNRIAEIFKVREARRLGGSGTAQMIEPWLRNRKTSNWQISIIDTSIVLSHASCFQVFARAGYLDRQEPMVIRHIVGYRCAPL